MSRTRSADNEVKEKQIQLGKEKTRDLAPDHDPKIHTQMYN